VRGEAVNIKETPHHVPIGLMNDAIIKHKIEQGQILEYDDVELPDSVAKKAWEFTLSLVK
jgi:predicted homoserine dehydrogenase-like protein